MEVGVGQSTVSTGEGGCRLGRGRHLVKPVEIIGPLYVPRDLGIWLLVAFGNDLRIKN